MSNDEFIIVVDEDDDDRLLLLDAIEESRCGIDVLVMTSGKSLMEFLNNCLAASLALPRLIILDYNLPGFDMKKAMFHLKAIPQLTKIPVVVFCASTLSRQKEEVYSLGFHRYFDKPSSFKKMIDIFDLIAIQMRFKTAESL